MFKTTYNKYPRYFKKFLLANRWSNYHKKMILSKLMSINQGIKALF